LDGSSLLDGVEGYQPTVCRIVLRSILLLMLLLLLEVGLRTSANIAMLL